MSGTCFCFTIETGGVIIATWHAVQLLFGIFFLLFYIGYVHEEFIIVIGIIALVISVAMFCISLLSIKGIDNRNHKFILPMLIWLFIAMILQLASSFLSLISSSADPTAAFGKFLHFVIISIGITVAVLSVLVFYSLYNLFKNESRHRNGYIYQQRFVPTTQKVEPHLESCS